MTRTELKGSGRATGAIRKSDRSASPKKNAQTSSHGPELASGPLGSSDLSEKMATAKAATQLVPPRKDRPVGDSDHAAPQRTVPRRDNHRSGGHGTRRRIDRPCRRRTVDSLPSLADLDDMPTEALRRLLLRLVGLKDAGRMSRELLLRAVAWHIQMQQALDGERGLTDPALADAARAVERRNKAMLRQIQQEKARREAEHKAECEAEAAAAAAAATTGLAAPMVAATAATNTASAANAGSATGSAGLQSGSAEPGSAASATASKNNFPSSDSSATGLAAISGAHPGALVSGVGSHASDGSRRRRPPAPRADPLPPGSRLIREWGGVTHEVIVQSDGSLLWRGQAWRSLSLIARTITGVAWSGPRFFGIIER